MIPNNDIKYYIFDEAHYFVNYAAFNVNTDYWTKISFIEHKWIGIYMTATPEPLYMFLDYHYNDNVYRKIAVETFNKKQNNTWTADYFSETNNYLEDIFNTSHSCNQHNLRLYDNKADYSYIKPFYYKSFNSELLDLCSESTLRLKNTVERIKNEASLIKQISIINNELIPQVRLDYYLYWDILNENKYCLVEDNLLSLYRKNKEKFLYDNIEYHHIVKKYYKYLIESQLISEDIRKTMINLEEGTYDYYSFHDELYKNSNIPFVLYRNFIEIKPGYRGKYFLLFSYVFPYIYNKKTYELPVDVSVLLDLIDELPYDLLPELIHKWIKIIREKGSGYTILDTMVISYVFFALNIPYDMEWHEDDREFYVRPLSDKEFIANKKLYDSYCKNYVDNITPTDYAENQVENLLTTKNKFKSNYEEGSLNITSHSYKFINYTKSK